MEIAEIPATALVSIAGVALVVYGVVVFVACARSSQEHAISRSLGAMSSLSMLFATGPLAILAMKLFLTGSPARAVISFCVAILGPWAVGTVARGAARWRFGKQDLGVLDTTKRLARARAVSQHPTVAWAFVSVSVAMGAMELFGAWALHFFLGAATTEMSFVVGLLASISAMGVSAAMVFASMTRTRQPFLASAAAAAVVGVPGLSSAVYFSVLNPGSALQLGLTEMAAFVFVVCIALAVYYRSVVRAVASAERDDEFGGASTG